MIKEKRGKGSGLPRGQGRRLGSGATELFFRGAIEAIESSIPLKRI